MEKKFKIENRSICVNIITPFSIGHFEFDIECQIFIFLDKEQNIEFDLDITEFDNIKVMGVKIESGFDKWGKIKSQLEDLGINVNKLVQEHVDKTITKEMIESKFYLTMLSLANV